MREVVVVDRRRGAGLSVVRVVRATSIIVPSMSRRWDGGGEGKRALEVAELV